MESTEFGANDHEHAKGLVGVFNIGQETTFEAEGQSDFGGLVKVGFENVPISNEYISMDIKNVELGGGLRTC